MTTQTIYIWASYALPSSANIASAFCDNDEPLHIHAFADECDHDGEGLGVNEQGALLWCEPSDEPHHTRVTLAIPAGDWVQHKSAVFSPACLGGTEADHFGMADLLTIKRAIASQLSTTQGA